MFIPEVVIPKKGKLSVAEKQIESTPLFSVILTVKPFNPLTQVNTPSGATHFRFVNSISIISDFAYNSTTRIYEPIELTLNELCKVTYSDYIDFGTQSATPITVSSGLSGTPTMTENVSLLACVGIEFYQKVGENYYLFSESNCLKIRNIF